MSYYSITYNLLQKFEPINPEYHRNDRLGFRLFKAGCTLAALSCDILFHTIATIVKLATGILVTLYSEFAGKTKSKNWTWSAASKHLSQVIKHIKLAYPLLRRPFSNAPLNLKEIFIQPKIKDEKKNSYDIQELNNSKAYIKMLEDKNQKYKLALSELKENRQVTRNEIEKEHKKLIQENNILKGKAGRLEVELEETKERLNQIRNSELLNSLRSSQDFLSSSGHFQNETKGDDLGNQEKDDASLIEQLKSLQSQLEVKEALTNEKDLLIRGLQSELGDWELVTERKNELIIEKNLTIAKHLDSIRDQATEISELKEQAIYLKLEAENAQLENQKEQTKIQDLSQRLAAQEEALDQYIKRADELTQKVAAVEKEGIMNSLKEIALKMNDIAKELFCNIDLYDFPKKAVVSTCGHIFDEELLKASLKKKPECPKCREITLMPKTSHAINNIIESIKSIAEILNKMGIQLEALSC